MSQHSQNLRLSHRRTATVLFLLLFGAAFGLYWFTLAPGVVGGDAGEHQLAVPLLGIPHTTGYPLYILVGKLWTVLLPVGSLAWRVNLFSALGGALAAALTGLVVLRLSTLAGGPLPVTWPGALVAGVGLALGLTLWQWSVIAGVRSFNVSFFALMTLLAIVWADQRRRGQVDAAARTLGWLALTVGLSLAHHRTTIFYLPPLAGWVLWHEWQLLRQPKRLLKLAGLTAAPLLLYAFIYIRGLNNPPYTHQKITDFQSFWFLVGSGDSTGLFFSIDPVFLPARLQFIWADVLAQLSWPGVILALVGALFLLWRQTAGLVMQAALVALLLLFTLDFEVVNLNEAPTWYLMPAYFIFAVWLGYGVNGILSSGLQPIHLQFKRRPWASIAVQLTVTAGLLLLLAASLGRTNWQIQRQQATAPLDDWRQRLRGDQARRFVETSLPLVKPNSIIWGDWEQYTPIKYYQLINGLRPDVTIRNPLDRWPEKVAAAHQAGRPIYFARKPTDLIGTPYLSMVGPLIYLGTEPQRRAPANITRLDINFEDELELVGYRAQVFPQKTPGGAQAGPILQVMFYWRARKKIEWDYALSLRLLDAGGQEIFKQDALHPVLSSYPTSLWTAGEVVGDFYELPLPLQGRPVSLQVLPYRSAGPGEWYNLTPEGASEPGIMLGPFQ